jgi:alanyl aminopeptidase
MSTLRAFVVLSLLPALALAEPKPPTLRLPDGARPTHATVELTIDPSQDQFGGVEDLDVTVKAPLATLWLNADGLTIAKAEAKVGGKTIAARVLPQPKSFVGFTFTEPLPAGRATLHIEWTGPLLTKDVSGATKQKERGEWYVFSKFEPIDARRVFPSFDEPAYKIPWKLSIKTPKALRAVANGAEESVTVEGDAKRYSFAETQPLPTYLVAFAVGPFDIVDAGKAKSGAPVRIITPRGEAAQARWAKQVSAEILSQLESWFGSPYAFGKLDCIAVPQFGGAMENPGLVTFGSGLILQKPEEETVAGKRSYARVAIHEFAHQWFGDLVTTAWWDDIWLNEAFASWMTPNIVEQWQPTWNAAEDRARNRNGALGSDELVSARRIRQPITSNDDIRNAFDNITYGKGQAVISMFEATVGREAFRKGVQRYLAAHAHGNGTATQFLAAISAEAGHDVSPAFSTFLDQAGAPAITFTTRCDAGKPPVVHLEQHRSLPVGTPASDAEKARTWRVPVCMRWSAGDKSGRACTELAGRSADVTLADAPSCPTALAPNDGASGYYRAVLDGDALGKLFADAKALSVPERLATLSDLAAMTSAGKLPYADALKIVPSVANDANRFVVQAALSLVAPLRDDGMLPESARPAFARFIRDHFGKRARALGWASKKTDDDDTRLLRSSLVPVVAEQGEDPALIAQAKKLTDAWLKDHRAVDAEMVDAVLTVTARRGDRALFDRLHAAAKKESDLRVRRRLLRAMSRFEDPAISRDAMALALGDEFDARESLALVRGATQMPATRTLAWEFVKTNFDKLAERLPRDTPAGFPFFATSQCSDAARADVDAFFRPRAAKFEGGPRYLEQALEELKLCTTYKSVQQPSIADFFGRLGATGSR